MQFIEAYIFEVLILAIGSFLGFVLDDRIKSPRLVYSWRLLAKNIPIGPSDSSETSNECLTVFRVRIYNPTVSKVDNIEVSWAKEWDGRRCWVRDMGEHTMPYTCAVEAQSYRDIIVYHQTYNKYDVPYPNVRREGIKVAARMLTRIRTGIFKVIH